MADRQLEFQIVTQFQSAGLDAAKQGLQEVTEEAKTTSETIANIPAANPPINAEKFAEIKDQLSGLSKDFKAVGTSVDDVSPKFTNLQQILGGVNQVARGGPEAIGGMARAINGIGAAAGVAIGPISLITGALALGVKLGTELAPVLLSVIDALEETFGEVSLTAKTAAAELERLNDVEVNFDRLKAGTEKAISRLDSLIQKVRQAKDTAVEIGGAKTAAESKGIEVERKRALLAAGDDDRLKTVINQIYDEKLAALQNAQQELTLSSAMKQKQAELNLLFEKRAQLEKSLADSTAAADKEMRRYQQALKALADAGYDTKKLLRDQEYRANAVATAGESDPRLEYLLTELPAFLSAAANAKGDAEATQTQELIPQLAAVATAIQEVKAAIEVLEQKRVEAAQDRELKSLEFGAESTAALNGLEKAIREQMARVEEARNNVQAASISGDAEAYSSSNATLLAEKDLLADLQLKYDQAAEQIRSLSSTLGQAYLDGAASVQGDSAALANTIRTIVTGIATAASDSAKAMSDSAATIQAGSATVQDGIKRSSDAFVHATSSAVGGMTGAIQSLGDRVVGSLKSVVDSISAVKARIATVEAAADSAEKKASTALSQIKNSSR